MKIGYSFEGEWRQTHKPRHTNYLTILLIVFFLLGDSPVSEFYVLKHRHIKFRRWWIPQKKEYNIRNRAKVLNQESCLFLYGRLSYEWSTLTSRSKKYFWHNMYAAWTAAAKHTENGNCIWLLHTATFSTLPRQFDYCRAAHRKEININCQSIGTKYPKIQWLLPQTLYFNISFINFIVENEHPILSSKLSANETDSFHRLNTTTYSDN